MATGKKSKRVLMTDHGRVDTRWANGHQLAKDRLGLSRDAMKWRLATNHCNIRKYIKKVGVYNVFKSDAAYHAYMAEIDKKQRAVDLDNMCKRVATQIGWTKKKLIDSGFIEVLKEGGHWYAM